MRNCRRYRAFVATVLFLACCSPACAQISLGKLNDFQDQTTQNWGQGPFSPSPSFVVSDGGPTGTGDAFLKNISTGSTGAGGRQAVFNAIDWVGNYTAAGVTRVEVQMINMGPTALSMRLGIEDARGTRYVSTNAIPLPADLQWHSLSFGIAPSDLSLDRGGESVDQALATVTAFRFMSASNPTFQGDMIASTLGIDNIHAVPEPGCTSLVVVASGILRRRRRNPYVSCRPDRGI